MLPAVLDPFVIRVFRCSVSYTDVCCLSFNDGRATVVICYGNVDFGFNPRWVVEGDEIVDEEPQIEMQDSRHASPCGGPFHTARLNLHSEESAISVSGTKQLVIREGKPVEISAVDKVSVMLQVVSFTAIRGDVGIVLLVQRTQ